MTHWAAIIEAVAVALGGDRDRGVVLLVRCWGGTGERDAAQRCVVAHYLADLQSTVDSEVAWDEAALVAFAEVGETDLTQVGIPPALALEPSLRLDLGDGYRRQGRLKEARALAPIVYGEDHPRDGEPRGDAVPGHCLPAVRGCRGGGGSWYRGRAGGGAAQRG